jgi:alanyl-tRNA synthetase
MKLEVNLPQRYAKMRAHTATHLLHGQLAALFPDTKQAGSLVDEDYLRFDFHADNLLTAEQIHDIESTINTQIYASHEVATAEMSFDDAIKKWAKAFFADKYGDVVRVVSIDGAHSVELCGGTHVPNTRDIGAFKITSQEPVAAGVKRITAYTWPKVIEYMREKDTKLQNIANKFGVTEKQLEDKIEKMLKDYTALEEELQGAKAGAIAWYIDKLTSSGTKDGFALYNIDSSYDLKQVVTLLKNKKEDLLAYNTSGSFAIVADISKTAKSFAQSHNLKWGWSDTFFQWKDPQILELLA